MDGSDMCGYSFFPNVCQSLECKQASPQKSYLCEHVPKTWPCNPCPCRYNCCLGSNRGLSKYVFALYACIKRRRISDPLTLPIAQTCMALFLSIQFAERHNLILVHAPSLSLCVSMCAPINRQSVSLVANMPRLAFFNYVLIPGMLASLLAATGIMRLIHFTPVLIP